MAIVKKNKKVKSQGASEVPSAHAIFPRMLPAVIHGLYLECSFDMRTRPGRALKGITQALLEGFPAPAPPTAQVIAQRCAVKLIRASGFEIFLLSGHTPAPNADRDYLALTNSIRADIEVLSRMARDGGPVEKIPNLQEYLATLKEAGGVTDAAPAAKVAADPSPEPQEAPAQPGKTLF